MTDEKPTVRTVSPQYGQLPHSTDSPPTVRKVVLNPDRLGHVLVRQTASASLAPLCHQRPEDSEDYEHEIASSVHVHQVQST